MNLTNLIAPFFRNRVQEIENFFTQAESVQRQVLDNLVRRASDTQWGRKHHYAEIRTYEDFAERVPLSTYEDLKADIDRMRQGEADVLWPGRVRWFAKSSGTTNDKSKFIPVSRSGLNDTHYAGGSDAVAIYLHNNPSRLLLNGREACSGSSLRVERACMAVKPPTPAGQIAASAPPVTMALALPRRIRLKASANALVEEAQAEVVV